MKHSSELCVCRGGAAVRRASTTHAFLWEGPETRGDNLLDPRHPQDVLAHPLPIADAPRGLGSLPLVLTLGCQASCQWEESSKFPISSKPSLGSRDH